MAKKNDNWFQNSVAGLSLRGVLFNPAILVILVSIATIAGTIYLWNQHQRAIVNLEDYTLTADKVTINESQGVPVAQLKELVATPNEESRPNSLLEPTLIRQTVQRLKQYSWVESIHNITKSKSGLKIELEYRKPIGIVELNRTNVLNWPENQPERLIPIDRNGVVMPDESVAESLARFTVFEPILGNHTAPWSSISDDRVIGCVKISEYLFERWKKYGLYRVTTLRPPRQPSDQAIPFQIWTDTKAVATKIIWGNPPGMELPGEASAETKLAALEKIFAEYGPLNELPPTTIDIRSGTPITSNNKTAKSTVSSGGLIK
jgi:hypothetical protein